MTDLRPVFLDDEDEDTCWDCEDYWEDCTCDDEELDEDFDWWDESDE